MISLSATLGVSLLLVAAPADQPAKPHKVQAQTVGWLFRRSNTQRYYTPSTQRYNSQCPTCQNGTCYAYATPRSTTSQPAIVQPAPKPATKAPALATPAAPAPQAPVAAGPKVPAVAPPAPIKADDDKSAAKSGDKPKAKAQPELHPVETSILSQTNAFRARYGLRPLVLDWGLLGSARRHASWMSRNHVMQHTTAPVAENIAMGQNSPQEAVNAWMNSSGHRANMLNSGYTRIGVAAYRSPSGTTFWCQQFLR